MRRRRGKLFPRRTARRSSASRSATLVVVAARHRHARQSREIHRDREDIRQIHRQRIVGFLAELECRWWARPAPSPRRSSRTRCSKSRRIKRAHLLPLQIVGIVVAGREREGAEHDAAFDLGAETFARACDSYISMLLSRLDAQTEADAVVAREIRARPPRSRRGSRRRSHTRCGAAKFRRVRAPAFCSFASASRTHFSTSGRIPSTKYSFGTPMRSPLTRRSARARNPARARRAGRVAADRRRPASAA